MQRFVPVVVAGGLAISAHNTCVVVSKRRHAEWEEEEKDGYPPPLSYCVGRHGPECRSCEIQNDNYRMAFQYHMFWDNIAHKLCPFNKRP